MRRRRTRPCASGMSRGRVQPCVRAQCLTLSTLALARAAINDVGSAVVSYSPRAAATTESG